MDVVDCVFMNGYLREEVAIHVWYDMLSSFLISNDFSKGLVDPTLFIRREGKELLLVQIYVDDIIFAASTPELCDLFAKIMVFKIQDVVEGFEDKDGKLVRFAGCGSGGCQDIAVSTLAVSFGGTSSLSALAERIEFLINKLGMRSFTPETLKS
ncbi:retrovirus-related pol polyprotein from transposon TNT 1-94 [Tanacetum coccineum]